jgi:hypothetical protein
MAIAGSSAYLSTSRLLSVATRFVSGSAAGAPTLGGRVSAARRPTPSAQTVGDQRLLTVDDVDHEVGAANVLVERQPLALGERVVGDITQTEMSSKRSSWRAQKLLDGMPDFVFSAAGPIHGGRDLGHEEQG